MPMSAFFTDMFQQSLKVQKSVFMNYDTAISYIIHIIYVIDS